MRTRKLLALLLALVMSLTMGGLTVFGDESGDTEKSSAEAAEPKEPAVSGEPENLTDKTEDADGPTDTDSTDNPNASIKFTEFPANPVKPGDSVRYTIEVDSNGADMEGWFLVISDQLKSDIDKNTQDPEEVPLSNGTATVSYEIPRNFYLADSRNFVNVVLTDGKDEVWGTYHTLAVDYSHYISVQPTLKCAIDFQTEGLVTRQEYPFTVTWTNMADYVIENFAMEVWSEIYDKVGDAYEKGAKPAYKITEHPAGSVVKNESSYAAVEKISIPVGGTIKISGTVSYPEEGISAQLHFNEIINGEDVWQQSTTGFKVNASAGGNGTAQQPGTGTDNSGNVVKDEASGITVSGLEEGVRLSVKPVSKEQQTAIEEKVKKLLGNTKGIKIFDISLLKADKEVRPGQPVKVTMPVPEGFSTNLKLYHQNEQGVLEPVTISVSNSVISFEAKSFSPYVLVDLGAKAANPSDTKSPKTGDTSPMLLYLMLAIAAMSAVGFAERRKMND